MVANARDLEAFSKLVKRDVFYTYSELHSGWICVAKKSGKESQERTLTEQERKMCAEAKLTEIENVEGSSAISFVTDPEEIRKIRESFSHRIMPSRFVLTEKQQELGQSWEAKARWILLGHRDPVCPDTGNSHCVLGISNPQQHALRARDHGCQQCFWAVRSP